MKASIWFRILAGVLAFFTFGHTVGTRHAITNLLVREAGGVSRATS